MRSLAAFSLSLLAVFTGVRPLAAHTLDPDVEDVGLRLQYCPHDLFRARQPDGTYLAEIAQEPLGDFYTGVLGQAVRRYFPGERIAPPEPRSVPALQLLDDALNVAYAHQIPLRLEREALLGAYFDLLRAEWGRVELQRVVGARVLRTPDGRIPGEIFGAALLSLAAADLHQRVAWGPGHLVNVIEAVRDPASWSLDGVPLSAPQFQALVADLDAALASMTAAQKIDLVGGHCLHFHPDLPGVNVTFAPEADGNPQDQEPATCAECGETIEVTTSAWSSFKTWLLHLFTLPGPTPGGGGGGGGEAPGPADPGSPSPDPECDAECQQRRQKRAECLAGEVSNCGIKCGSPSDCRACCLSQARARLGPCDWMDNAELTGDGTDFLATGRLDPPISPGVSETCETALANTFLRSCYRLCPNAGDI